MLDILCVGDAKIDIFLQVLPGNPHVGLDKTKNKLEISFGEKIYVDKYVLETGGNATNTAVGISRLGFNTGIVAEIGKDEFSAKILNNLKAENVNTNSLLQTDTEKSSFSIILSYDAERTIFSEHVERNHDFNFENLNTKFVYITSLGKIWEKAYEKALKFVETNDLKLAFNPGTLQIEKRGKILMDILERTDYLFVNKEEAEEILYGKEVHIGLSETKTIEKLLYGLKSLGAKNVIITDSDKGSYLGDEENNVYSIGIAPSEVVEKTGAGDSYTAGFLAAILNGLPSNEAMIWGSVNSASVIQKVGAQKGLLTKQELDKKIKELNNFYPTKL
jgi:ribokinase